MFMTASVILCEFQASILWCTILLLLQYVWLPRTVYIGVELPCSLSNPSQTSAPHENGALLTRLWFQLCVLNILELTETCSRIQSPKPSMTCCFDQALNPRTKANATTERCRENDILTKPCSAQRWMWSAVSILMLQYCLPIINEMHLYGIIHFSR